MSRAVDLLASKLPKPRKSVGQRLREKLPFPTHIPLHASITYLFGICLFSISFLVFLNSSLSFVVTDLLGIKEGIGGIVGTLGFVDELVAVFTVVMWGALSDKIGTRVVAVCGYLLVGISLYVIVQVKSVYPGLLLARMLFSLGASATVVSVTAVLPEISTLPPSPQKITGLEQRQGDQPKRQATSEGSHQATSDADRAASSNRSTVAASSSSASTSSTIVPQSSRPPRRRPGSRMQQKSPDYARPITGKLSGTVGFTAGLGALIALAFFLPLPAKLAQDNKMSKAQALRHAFYIVGGIAWLIALAVFVGLRGGGIGGDTWEFWKIGNYAKLLRRNSKDKDQASLEGDADPENAQNGQLHEGSALLSGNRDTSDEEDDMDQDADARDISYGIPPPRLPPVIESEATWKDSVRSYFGGLWYAAKAGHEDWRLGLAYVGGFIARSMSVGISLFIPLYVNQWMRSRGMCPPTSPSDPDFKKSCRDAYILAAELTGTSQLCALIFAPIIGYFSDRYEPQGPLLVTSILGFCACAGFSALGSLAVGADRSWAFVHCALMGIAQIGAIVSSLALVGNAINGPDAAPALHQIESTHSHSHSIISEAASVNPMPMDPQEYKRKTRLAMKGCISGVYSLCGAVGILILTKFGGWGADHANSGFAFDLLAAFFAIEIALGGWLVMKGKKLV